MASRPRQRTAPGAGDAGRLLAHHRAMTLLRAADELAAGLARRRRLGLVTSAAGTEAVLSGVAAAIEDRDWVLPGVRQSHVALLRGLAPAAWLAQLVGGSADPSRGRSAPGGGAFRSVRVVSASTPTGSQLPIAAGVARAMRSAGRGEVAVALAGDAACATGDFHVGLNFAALWAVPVVFVVLRGARLDESTATPSVAMKASAYGLPGLEIDGSDPAAVESAVHDAAARARGGGGPTLLDAACPSPEPPPLPHLRLVGGERDADEWSDRDPLARLGRRLLSLDAADEDELGATREVVDAMLRAALADVDAAPPPDPSLLFDDVFARPTPALRAQASEWWRTNRGEA